MMTIPERTMNSTMPRKVFVASRLVTIYGCETNPFHRLLIDFLKRQGFDVLTEWKNASEADLFIVISTSLISKAKSKGRDGARILAMPFADHGNFKIKKKGIVLSNVKALNQTDAVLVETQGQKRMLEKEGVSVEIQVISALTPTNHRESISDVEKETFGRYYGIRKSQHSASILGSLSNFKVAESLARMSPSMVFVFFDMGKGSHKKRWITEKVPNLYYEFGIRGEIYQSMMATTSGLVILDEWFMDSYIANDAKEARLPMISVNLPLMADGLKENVDYELVECSPFEIYDRMKKIRDGKTLGEGKPDSGDRSVHIDAKPLVEVIEMEIVSSKVEE